MPVLSYFMSNKKNASIALYFITIAIFIICNVYASALFLSRYPTSWLPYFYCFTAIIEIINAYSMAPILKQNPQQRSLYVLIILIILTILFYSSLQLKYYLLPFIYCMFLISLSALVPVIAWNLIHLTFDIIEFKTISNYVVIAGNLGSVAMSFLIIPIIKAFKTSSLSFVLIFLLILSAFLVYPLKPLSSSTTPKRLTAKTNPIKYPLFRKLFISVLVVSIIYVFIDYCFKVKLAQTFNERQIAFYLAIFTGITASLSLLFNFIGARFIQRIAPASLLLIIPVYWTITGLITIFLPTLLVVSVMLAGRNIFYYGIFALGLELMLNVLPNQIRIAGQFQAKIAGPLAIVITAVALFILDKFTGISFIAGIITVLSIFLLFYVRNLDRYYLNTLKEEVQLKRFNLIDELDPAQAKNLIGGALKSDDANLVRFGFSLLARANYVVPRKILENLVLSAHPDIQIDALMQLAKTEQKKSIPFLLRQLTKEANPEVQWALYETLTLLRANEILPIARQHLHDAVAEVRAGAIRALLAEGDLSDAADAICELKQMLESENPDMRKNTSRIIGSLNIGNLNKELINLIEDIDPNVSSRAIDAAIKRRAVEIAAVIIDRMSQRGVYFPAEKYLMMLGDKAIPLLMQSIEINKTKHLLHVSELIRALASLPNPEVESSLYKLALDDNTVIRNVVAKEAAYRARRITPSHIFKQQVYTFLLTNVKLIHFLRTAEAGQQPHVVREIKSRKWMAKKRFLYWLAVYTDAREVISYVPTLMYGTRVDQAKTIELMRFTIRNNTLSALATDIFLLQNKVELTESPDASICYDSWLRKVMEFESTTHEGTMHEMQKVFVLRSVNLFKMLPGETLLIIAESTEVIEMHPKQIIFNEGDQPTGLYIVVSGQVDIVKNKQTIASLKENDIFGELALLDNSTRTATAIAKSEGTLLFLDKETFDRITDDLPDVLRSVIQMLMRYLRQYIG